MHTEKYDLWLDLEYSNSTVTSFRQAILSTKLTLDKKSKEQLLNGSTQVRKRYVSLLKERINLMDIIISVSILCQKMLFKEIAVTSSLWRIDSSINYPQYTFYNPFILKFISFVYLSYISHINSDDFQIHSWALYIFHFTLFHVICKLLCFITSIIVYVFHQQYWFLVWFFSIIFFLLHFLHWSYWTFEYLY